MACRNAFRRNPNSRAEMINALLSTPDVPKTVKRLLFGVDSKTRANDLLQNNIDEFEWVVRNKISPNFFGRYLTGENCLTKDEITYIHKKGCKIAAIYKDSDVKQTEEQGELLAKKIDIRALELGIPEGTAIFLEIEDDEKVSAEFMHGFAKALMVEGYTPAFKANTDAKFPFDREFGRGTQKDKDIFEKCLIWAVSPTIPEYNGMTTSHLIHPDTWKPFAPSAISRREIAVWQYGNDCHPIEDDNENPTSFNLDLVRNEQVIIQKMF